jgi:hypothetical protein
MSDQAEYEQDFFLWSQQQARILREAKRSGVNLPLDWENVAEEIEGLGRSDRSEIESRIETIIEHLLKLQSSPAVRPRRGWQATILRERARLAKRLEQSRSLRREVPQMIAQEMATARAVVGMSGSASISGRGRTTTRTWPRCASVKGGCTRSRKRNLVR